MNVKLQIKEVKDERRRLSDFEWYAYFAGQCIVEPLIYLDKVGLILQSVDTFGRVGTFRTETIRDATPEEIIAWQCIVSYNHCMTAPGLSVCSKSPGGYCCGWFCYHDRLKSYKLLRGKEVIVSLTEESI